MGLVGAQGEASVKILKWLSVWVMVGVMNNIVGLQLLGALGATRYYMRSFVVSSLAYVGLAFLLTQNSVAGPAIALLIGEVILLFLVVVKAIKITGGNREIS